uniref:Tat protein n=1 Tax=Globodera pallida TaxID=36090 RepID=A0A183CTP5_GLOPA
SSKVKRFQQSKPSTLSRTERTEPKTTKKRAEER